MKLLDIMTSPWVIVPSKLREIRDVYLTHMKGEKIDLKKMKGDRPAQMEAPPYQTVGGVAVIGVEDVLTKSRSFFSFLFGGTSMRDIADSLSLAMEDVNIHSIVLHIDSPGGTVDGTESLANFIQSHRGKKPITAFADGMIASAAYWIGASADKIIISGDTTEVGSIGVVATHVDVSKQDEMFGEKYTEITAGKYKRIASMHKPLSDEGKSYIQEQVDHIYSVFVESVASLRGRSVEQVLEMADGRLYIGKAAVDAGLVDGIATLNEVINQLEEENRMDKIQMKEKYPDVYASIVEEGRVAGLAEGIEQGRVAGLETGRTEGLVLGAEGERTRIKEVEDALIPGHETLIATLKLDGKTTGDMARKAVIEAEKLIRGDELKKITADAIKPAAHAEAPVVDAAIENLPIEQKAKITWDKTPDLRKEFGENFEAYLAFMKNDAAGRVRILGRKA